MAGECRIYSMQLAACLFRCGIVQAGFYENLNGGKIQAGGQAAVVDNRCDELITAFDAV